MRGRRGSIVVILLLCLAAAGGVAAVRCGLGGAHLPDVAIAPDAGQKRGEVTIDVTSHGSGVGFGEMVITYPDGHRRGGWRGLLEDGTGWAPSLRSLHRGRYEYTLYAVAGPLTSQTLAALRVHKKQDVVATGSFWVE